MMREYTPHANSILNIHSKEYDYLMVQQVLNGNMQCWETLYKNAYSTVLQCAMKTDYQRLFRYHDYRDIADEAFALCYAQLERYQGWSRFCYWVSGYAKNITRNRCDRENVRLRNQRTFNLTATHRMIANDPLRILVRRERDKVLWDVFGTLAFIDRKILIRRAIEDYSFTAIGAELRLARKEVLRRYGYAATDLRQRFVHAYCIDTCTAEENSHACWRTI